MQPITIILTEGYSDWEIAALAGAGRAFFGADIRFASPSGGPLTSAAGLPIADTAKFTSPKQGVIVVCGGSAWEAAPPAALEDELLQARAHGCILAGICGGTVPLANAGLLNNVAHTSNGMDYLVALAPRYGGASNYRDVPHAVRDKNIITAPAPAPASFATEVLIAAGLDEQAAQQVRTMLSQEHVARLS